MEKTSLNYHYRLCIAVLAVAAALQAFAHSSDSIRVLQWNIWQEGSKIPGGKKAIVDEIVRLRPDFVTLSEVRNYNDVDYTATLVADLAARGETYYSFRTDDTGLLSRYPIADTLTVFPLKDDHGSIYRLRATDGKRRYAVYTAHLDYLNDAYYDVRGYDGSTWEEIPIPGSVDEVLRRNVISKRDDAIADFIATASRDRDDGYVVILGGDFNEPSHRDWTADTRNLYDHNGMVIPWTVTTMLENSGFIDTYRALYPDPLTHPGFTYPSDNSALPPEKITWAPKADERDRIDYIWVSAYPGMTIADARIFGPSSSIARSQRVDNYLLDPFILPLGVWPTDHKGLLVTLRFSKP